MNEQVKVTCITLHTNVHSLIVPARVSEAYIHFAFMHTEDEIFAVVPIKDLINEGGDPTTPFKLARGKKPSVSHLRMLYFHFLYVKLLHMLGQRR